MGAELLLGFIVAIGSGIGSAVTCAFIFGRLSHRIECLEEDVDRLNNKIFFTPRKVKNVIR